jgi:hypothetical protein
LDVGNLRSDVLGYVAPNAATEAGLGTFGIDKFVFYAE